MRKVNPVIVITTHSISTVTLFLCLFPLPMPATRLSDKKAPASPDSKQRNRMTNESSSLLLFAENANEYNQRQRTQVQRPHKKLRILLCAKIYLGRVKQNETQVNLAPSPFTIICICSSAIAAMRCKSTTFKSILSMWW